MSKKMTLAELNALGFAYASYDMIEDIWHFDCGGGERYTMPGGAVWVGPMVDGYPQWVARIEGVRSAAGITTH